ncbi:MAG: DMT family protein [Myxococcota bacterium]
MKRLLVPLLIAISGAFMASAWLVHLKYRDQIGFFTALLASWAIVLPEYALNVAATRYGFGTYSGAQMAAFHLASGVVFVALVSRFVLGEPWATRQFVGFLLLTAGMMLMLRPSH